METKQQARILLFEQGIEDRDKLPWRITVSKLAVLT